MEVCVKTFFLAGRFGGSDTMKRLVFSLKKK